MLDAVFEESRCLGTPRAWRPAIGKKVLECGSIVCLAVFGCYYTLCLGISFEVVDDFLETRSREVVYTTCIF